MKFSPKSSLKNLIFFLCLILMIFWVGCSSSDKNQEESTINLNPLKTEVSKDDLELKLDQQIPALMDKAMIPGLSLGLIRDGQLFISEAFGNKNNETSESVAPDTMFEACSLSKPVFAYAALKMVDQGLIDLDTPLAEYVPEEYIRKRFLGTKFQDERYKKITARMVLSHSPGFPNWRRGTLTIMFEPGARFSYSGEGYVFLQRILTHLKDQSLNDIMQEYVFSPLGMTNSSYLWNEQYDEQLAFPHNLHAKTGRKRKPRENAAASLVTTASDYARFLCALLNREGLKPGTFDAMLSPQSQLFSEDFPGMFFWGLGVGLQHTQQGDMIWHWGDNGDFKCFFAAFLKQKTGAVYFANSANGLGIAEDLLLTAVGGEFPVFQTPLVNDYPRHDSPMMKIQRIYLSEGFDAALNLYESLKRQQLESEVTKEPFLNSFGYTLLNQKLYDEAIRIFQMNIELFPDSWNVYDSLGEAYMKAGEKQLAIQNYQRSLELNPDNQGGKSALKRLGVKD